MAQEEEEDSSSVMNATSQPTMATGADTATATDADHEMTNTPEDPALTINHSNEDGNEHENEAIDRENQPTRMTRTSRRKSNRARRQPELFSSQQYDPARSSKRKRNASDAQDGSDDAENGSDNQEEGDDDEDEDESMSDADDDDAPDDGDFRAKGRAAAKKGGKKSKTKSTTSRRASANGAAAAHKQKRARTGDAAGTTTTQLAFRPAANSQRSAANAASAPKPRRKRVRPSGFVNEDGLYAEVFGRGNNVDAVAADWLTAYEKHNVNALTSFVNFILRCSGTTLTVTPDDISDVDNAANRLNDLQEEYQAQGIVDYPLISRTKKYRNFKESLVEFIESLIRTLHSAGILYTDDVLIENILVWITSMSSAAIRPFRHTTTVVSLAMVSALCRIAREIMTTSTNTRKRLETERKKKTVNKGRVSAMQATVDESESRLEIVNRHISDCIDTVFVHRYRDVDPKIRAECMRKLGEWIGLYREQFFDSNYLRYMGWVLSDVAAATRSVVVKELKGVFANKDNIPGLRVFTEKFRPRIVEMALRDAETDVRSSAVELLDLIRKAGLLEPEDVDAVGRLVFDSEAKVRKAAGKFFVENIEDVYETVREGLEEAIDESLMEDDDGDVDDLETPRRSWIKFKCLADTLEEYNAGTNTTDSNGNNTGDISPEYDLLVGAAGKVTSRFALATEAIYPHFEELQHWESLAGYLLYDHSQIPEAGADEEDPALLVKNLYKAKEGQETLLLEVLCSAVNLHITDLSKTDTETSRSNTSTKKKSRSALLQEQSERRTDVAHHLSQIIPQLLSKFGSAPEAAASILRLEHLLDYSALSDLQRSMLVYKEILGAVSKQFLTHSDRTVLAEATAAMIHAKENGKDRSGVEEVREVVDGVVGELWKTTVQALETLAKTDGGDGGEEAEELGSEEKVVYSVDVLSPLCDAIARIQNLSSVADSVPVLEGKGAVGKKRNAELPVDLIMRLAKRGVHTDEAKDAETEALERRLVQGSYGVLLVYFLWKIQAVRTALQANSKNFNADELEALIHRRDQFSLLLTETMNVKSGVDILRFSATRHLLDLYIACGTLRYAAPGGEEIGSIQGLGDEVKGLLRDLVREIDGSTKTTISKIHDTYEKRYAKKAKRILEVVPAEEKMDDIDPEAPVNADSDEEDDSDSDDDEEDDEDSTDSAVIAERLRAELLAEQQLCELTGKIVLAIIGRVIDDSGPMAGKLREKISRNKTRLGANYREVVSYLDPEKATGLAGKRGRGGSGTRGKGGAKGGAKKQFKSLDLIVEEEEEEGENENANENEGGELREDPIEDDQQIQLDLGEGEGAVGGEGIDDDDDAELSDAPPDMEDVEIEI
ncbi:mitotic cohesin complex [Ascosphaera apis ARSEF 7405]|uniref:Mitotic cohesin complex n=1 Tax=Ascosphaera apis ARSEF 7405 TaxID=392613 RepID=A0A166NQ56_9EURO|nr:mitotic cohesin complex [Ascosphaera apis ARSEF 7405]